MKGFNDFETHYHDLAAQWHPTKNGELKPYQISRKANKKVWWLFPYDDPKTGKHFDFEWDAYIYARVKNPGCPFLTSQRVWPGFNDLASNNHNLALQWDYEKNDGLKPSEFMPNSRKEVWWIYPYDDPTTGRHFDFSWHDKICNRTENEACPFLTHKKVWPTFNDFATIHEDLAEYSHA